MNCSRCRSALAGLSLVSRSCSRGVHADCLLPCERESASAATQGGWKCKICALAATITDIHALMGQLEASDASNPLQHCIGFLCVEILALRNRLEAFEARSSMEVEHAPPAAAGSSQSQSQRESPPPEKTALLVGDRQVDAIRPTLKGYFSKKTSLVVRSCASRPQRKVSASIIAERFAIAFKPVFESLLASTLSGDINPNRDGLEAVSDDAGSHEWIITDTFDDPTEPDLSSSNSSAVLNIADRDLSTAANITDSDLSTMSSDLETDSVEDDDDEEMMASALEGDVIDSDDLNATFVDLPPEVLEIAQKLIHEHYIDANRTIILVPDLEMAAEQGEDENSTALSLLSELGANLSTNARVRLLPYPLMFPVPASGAQKNVGDATDPRLAAGILISPIEEGEYVDADSDEVVAPTLENQPEGTTIDHDSIGNEDVTTVAE